MEVMGSNPWEAMLNNKYETKLRRYQQTARDECPLIRRDGEGREPARGAGWGNQGGMVLMRKEGGGHDYGCGENQPGMMPAAWPHLSWLWLLWR